MKQTFELQQEFEGLISELSRLKSINEITSENSNNAKKTIEEIESFVAAVSIFKTSVEKDYLEKKNIFEKFENTLETSIKSLEINIDQQAKRFEELGNNYTEEAIKSIEKIDKSFGEKIKSKLHNAQNEIEVKIEAKNFDSDFTKLNTYLDQTKKEIHIAIKDKNFDFNFDELHNKILKIEQSHNEKMLLLNKDIKFNKRCSVILIIILTIFMIKSLI